VGESSLPPRRGTASFVGLEPATVSGQPLRLALGPALGVAALAHLGAALRCCLRA
jgi:hypothetical protein